MTAVEAPEQNRSATVRIRWADAKHTFRLGIGELRELQEQTNFGPRELIQRLQTGREFIDDVFETLRIGLIGGGMAPDKASELCERYAPPNRPYLESVPAAQLVLMAAVVGAPEEGIDDDAGDDDAGKQHAAEGGQSLQTESSPSPQSTAPEPQ